jgi:indolepyruvate ferredoxin oxidoreductase
MAALEVLAPRAAPLSLEDRYELSDGRVFLSGVQALVRVLLDQHRADRAAGSRTAAMVSGYQGSPLGGFDREVARLGALAVEHDIVHRRGLNEELGATAVWGSQMATTLPGARYDGVLGVWYGKAPGVDRAADAIRHGNFAGTDPRGGVLALCGDDPESKSSTLPSASEGILAALEVPTFSAGSVQELLDLGRHAIACSRASGLWSALKVATAVADATASVAVGPDRVRPVVPTLDLDGVPYVHRPSAHLLAPDSLIMERTLREVRLPLARLYARVNGLNPLTHPAPGARLGIVAAGTAYHQLLQAVEELGLPADHNLRILKIGMPFPLDAVALREFAAGLDEVLVIEEKGPFLERLVKEALYGMAAAPTVLGEHDDRGARLVPATGGLSADVIAGALGGRLLARGEAPQAVSARLEAIAEAKRRAVDDIGAARTPFFCSGCPHNASTQADDDALVGAGIGCHTMVMLQPAGRGAVAGVTQMGGEGLQWVGVAPFIERRHFVQNLGDGTLHHSGSLAIRAAVAAKLNVTYKILYNDTVAMTGGQHVEGKLSVPALARSLQAEGVARIVVTADDPSRYAQVDLPDGVALHGRDQLRRTQRELAEIDGVTVLIHDQACATELRRARKRGKASEPPQQILINERVCEGCGDCGEKSGCLSVEPVETEFGRKTRIHQSSCNKDFSCLEGDCPSFLEIIPPKAAKPAQRAALPLPPVALPDPTLIVPADDTRIRLVGIGGTGVVTVSQVLGMAALIDGRHTAGLDQTGLSQKAGPVASDVRISSRPVESGASASAGGIDLLVGLDVIGTATARHLELASAARTVAVVSTSVVPTASMVLDVHAGAPDVPAALEQIDAVTRREANVALDAQELAETIFGDHMPANMLVLGAAFQRGAIPVSIDALRQAITLNGTAVETNLAALEWGRAWVAAPEAVAAAMVVGDDVAPLSDADAALVDGVTTRDGALRRLLEVRVPELAAWGGRRAARRYVDELARVSAAEQERTPGATAVTEAAAAGLYKLMAYKDEYEVARLHLAGLRDLAPGTKVKFLLHPPLLRAMGLQHKVKLGRWFVPAFRLLAASRRLRGTALDPFGRAEVRRVERALPDEYLALLDRGLARLEPATAPAVVALAQLPDVVRGYEDIKLANVERFRARADELLAGLDG